MIYPESFPNKLLDPEKRKDAEKKVYDLLRKKWGRDDKFLVFYNVDITNEVDPFKENDFFIVHPTHGILCIEVKGGGVKFDPDQPHDKCWTSEDRNRKIHYITNPMSQGRNGMYWLKERIDDKWQGKAPKYRHQFMSIFPDSAKLPNENCFGPNTNKVLTKVDMADLGRKILTNWIGSGKRETKLRNTFEKLESKGLEIAKKVLRGEKTDLSKIKLSEEFEIKKKEFKKLSQEQLSHLDSTQTWSRAVFLGASGTGKSFLAQEKAKRLAKEGKSVALICGTNKPFSHEVIRTFDGIKNVYVAWFHEFKKKYQEEAGTYQDDTLKIHEEDKKLYEAIGKTKTRYDALIIDEANDLKLEWMEVLKFCLKDPDKGQYFIFLDNNQKIYNPESSIPSDFPKDQPLLLTENWRNTKNIFKAVNNYYQGEIKTRPVGPSGEIINPILLKKNENKIKKVDELVKYYLYEEGLRAEQIAILTGSKYGLGSSEYCIHGSAFSKEIFPEKCVLAESSNSNEIVFDSIKRFKGLERDVIILVELENLIEQQKFQELYIALSRARILLDIVIENEKVFESIKKNIL